MNFLSLKDPVVGPLWVQTVLMEKVSAEAPAPFAPPRGVVKYSQPPALVPRSVPRRGLRSRLQNLPRGWQRVGLPTPHRGVPGRAGGGGGAQRAAVGVHGSVRGRPPLQGGCEPGRGASLEMRFQRAGQRF